ncbi:hypothetical protein, partial [Xanthomonas arboricola]|uniref:hypothetical protein n=1 Tax=Xanthomonas arboricola TaxID=56448 RepID=UPI0006A4BAED
GWGGVEGLQVTFSAGVAELRDDDTGSSLMQRADQALYGVGSGEWSERTQESGIGNRESQELGRGEGTGQSHS